MPINQPMPFVAVTMDFETGFDRRGTPTTTYAVSGAYLAALERAGIQPVLLPHPTFDLPPLLTLPTWVNGLLIIGGDFDIPPDFYGQVAHPKLGKLCRARSHFEIALLTAAVHRQLPVLGICGGMQLLNVWGGGTLWQDTSLYTNPIKHQQEQDKRLPGHMVTIQGPSLLEQLIGAEPLPVNSTHHQFIQQISPKFRASATAPDGVIEAIELIEKPFVLGVQWHPEVMAQGDEFSSQRHQAIYDGFAAACRVNLQQNQASNKVTSGL